jgi:predicted nucleic acid-binding protein
VIVVDTNVLAYLYLPGEHTADAEALMKTDSDWAAPTLGRSEFRNILAGYMRRKTLTFDQAIGLQSEAEDLLAAAEYEVDSRAVFELIENSDCSAYDCEFIALAKRLQTRLVTLDKKLLKAFPEMAVSLADACG